MYFVLNNDDVLLEALLSAELNKPFDKLQPEAVISKKEVYVKEIEGKHLVIQPCNGLWCMLNTREFAFFESLQGQTYAALCEEYEESVLGELLYYLYLRDIININGEGFLNEDLLERGPVAKRGPLYLIVPTERCNFRCKYCFACAEHSEQPVMSMETVQNIIRFIRHTGQKSGTIEFAGGEALVAFDFIKKTVQMVKEQIPESEAKISFAIQTNAVLLDEEKLQFIKENDIRIGISLDGNKETNDKTRVYASGKGTYEDIYKAMLRMDEAGVKHGIISVATPENMNQIPEMMEHYKGLGRTSVKFNPIFEIGRAKENWSSLAVSPDEYLKAQEKNLRYVEEEKEPVVDGNLKYFLRHMTSLIKPFRCMVSDCGAGSSFFTFGTDGSVYACSRYRGDKRFLLGNVNDGLLPENIHNEAREQMCARKVSQIPQCSQCEFRHFCEGGCSIDSFVHSGDWNSPYPWCEYNKGIIMKLFECIARDGEFVHKLYSGFEIIDEDYL